jgi:hypothetical protein
MNRYGLRNVGHRIRAMVAVVTLLGLAWWLAYDLGCFVLGVASSKPKESIPNNHPQKNPGGKAATFSTQGSVNLSGEYFQAQGTNGRSCASCHIPEEAWSINPGTLQDLFDKTDGTHPVFANERCFLLINCCAIKLFVKILRCMSGLRLIPTNRSAMI